jgi:hypothetical protein
LAIASSTSARSPPPCVVEAAYQLLKLVKARDERGIGSGRPASPPESRWHRRGRQALWALRRMMGAKSVLSRREADQDAGGGTLPPLTPVPGGLRGPLRRDGEGCRKRRRQEAALAET